MPRAVEGAGSEPVSVGAGVGNDPVMPVARCLMLAANTALRIVSPLASDSGWYTLAGGLGRHGAHVPRNKECAAGGALEPRAQSLKKYCLTDDARFNMIYGRYIQKKE